MIVPNKDDIRRFIPKWENRHYWQSHCHTNYLSNINQLKLYDFDLNTLTSNSNLSLKIKTYLDNSGLHIGGLYRCH